MREFRNRVLLVCVSGFLSANVACSEEGEAEEEVKPPEPQKPMAFLDIANSGDGSYPGGSTPKKGKWAVDAKAKTLNLGVEPLDIGWLEFGPEIREKGSTILATAKGPGEGRLQSRFGVGLYGKNGFQIRLQQVKDEVELVRRGAVLTMEPFPLQPGTSYQMELSVLAEEEDWIVTGRVWEEEKERPNDPLFLHKVSTEELLFPLAGRPCLVATPFSGEPVSYLGAELYEGAYEPPIEKAEEDESEATEEEKDEANPENPAD